MGSRASGAGSSFLQYRVPESSNPTTIKLLYGSNQRFLHVFAPSYSLVSIPPGYSIASRQERILRAEFLVALVGDMRPWGLVTEHGLSTDPSKEICVT